LLHINIPLSLDRDFQTQQTGALIAMAALLRQAEFDLLVKEFLDSGRDFADSCQEAIETFIEEGADMDRIFVYKTEQDLREKNDVERRCATIANTARGAETFINCNFAIQGLKTILTPAEGNEGSYIVSGAWGMMEATQCVYNLFTLLTVPPEAATEEGGEMDVDKVNSTCIATAPTLSPVPNTSFHILTQIYLQTMSIDW
jgi:hypothetical protein